MKTLVFTFLWVGLNPTVTPHGSVAAEVNDVGGAPLSALGTLDAVMESFAATATAFAETSGTLGYESAA